MKKTPFRQQVSQYDCVPTTFVNAVSYLFGRSEIPPAVIQRIYLYCLDSLSSGNKSGYGTSGLAIQVLGQWLGSYRTKNFHLESNYYTGDEVHLDQGNRISRYQHDDGVALLRVTHGGGYTHYILALGTSDGWINCYDPYKKTSRANKRGCYEFLEEHDLHSPNLRIARAWLNKKSNQKHFHLGSMGERECLLLKRIGT